MDDQALVDAACRANIPAFNQLALRHQGVAYNVAFRILGEVAAAEDATQEAFLSAYRAIGGFRRGSFRTWVLRIVTNKCLDQLRTEKRRPTLALDALLVEPEYSPTWPIRLNHPTRPSIASRWPMRCRRRSWPYRRTTGWWWCWSTCRGSPTQRPRRSWGSRWARSSRASAERGSVCGMGS
jgi:hypothetical protein